MVGSANYGYRSVEKDLEAQMTIVTRNPDLQKSLHHEENRLFQSSEAVTKETLTEKYANGVFESRRRIVPTFI